MARQKKEEVVRPDEELPAEKMTGRRNGSTQVTKKAMMKKAERRANAAESRRKPPGWKQRLLSFLYDSGVDGHYPTEVMRKEAGLSIMGKSNK